MATPSKTWNRPSMNTLPDSKRSMPRVDDPTIKQCRCGHCKLMLPATFFYKMKIYYDYLCMSCRSTISGKHYKNNTAAIKKQCRKYYDKHRAKYLKLFKANIARKAQEKAKRN